jgi:N-acyl-D-aspartate/D-glutamate deacylase
MMKSGPDAVLAGGTIVDGTGAAAFPGDVVIRGGRIAEVVKRDPGIPADAKRPDSEVIDCTGLVVAPGFIDGHSHSDLQVLQNKTEKLLQGVTAEVVGNCGFSAYPLSDDPAELRHFANGILCGNETWGWKSAGDYLASAQESRVATVSSLVGQGSLRIKVAGNTSRALTNREIDQMTGLLDDALQEGAVGFSSGLMYAPGSGAGPEELIALCRVVERRNKVYATHMRSYSAGLVTAVEEQLAIAKASGCRLQISHLQAAGEDYWPLQQEALDAIEHAAATGVDVAFDVYPWLAGSTVLTQVFPQDALDGGIPKLLARLRDPAQREAIRGRIKPEARWNGVVITAAAKEEAALVGRSVQEIADERAIDPESAVLEILLEQEGDATIVEHCQSPDNLRALVTHPLASVVTDGVYTRGRSHPRLYGTFPLLLGNLVRERKWLGIEEAIHKITAKPAATFHFDDCGRIAKGYTADITVFDPQAINTEATYEAPDVVPTGIRAVMRSGMVVVNHGRIA